MGPIKDILKNIYYIFYMGFIMNIFNNLTLFFFKESIPRNKHFMLILYITRKFFII